MSSVLAQRPGQGPIRPAKPAGRSLYSSAIYRGELRLRTEKGTMSKPLAGFLVGQLVPYAAQLQAADRQLRTVIIVAFPEKQDEARVSLGFNCPKLALRCEQVVRGGIPLSGRCAGAVRRPSLL